MYECQLSRQCVIFLTIIVGHGANGCQWFGLEGFGFLPHHTATTVIIFL
jgi:hypothetical protein